MTMTVELLQNILIICVEYLQNTCGISCGTYRANLELTFFAII